MIFENDYKEMNEFYAGKIAKNEFEYEEIRNQKMRLLECSDEIKNQYEKYFSAPEFTRRIVVTFIEKINFKVYKTAIYARLSKENQNGEKIETQIEEIKNYIENRRIFEIVNIYLDNGYSGTNFQKTEFERLMEDIRNRKIDCIIVRDLSRFARETSRKLTIAKRELQNQGKFIG